MTNFKGAALAAALVGGLAASAPAAAAITVYTDQAAFDSTHVMVENSFPFTSDSDTPLGI